MSYRLRAHTSYEGEISESNTSPSQKDESYAQNPSRYRYRRGYGRCLCARDAALRGPISTSLALRLLLVFVMTLEMKQRYGDAIVRCIGYAQDRKIEF
jgi:hypothetical protein